MRQLLTGLPKYMIVFVVLLTVLTGCRGRNYVVIENEHYRLPRKVTGTADAAVIALQAKLKSCGITVITTGQDYLISIPSSYLFPNQSPRLTWNGFGVLNLVVTFMKQFRKVAVNVTSHSTKYVSNRRELSLTEARSRAVADYLWSQGIDSRFIFTEGAGSEKPITAYPGYSDKSPNSRIDITFRDTIV